MRILITGSNGLLGQKIVNALSNDNSIDLIATSKGLNRLSTKTGYKYLSFDITDIRKTSKILAEYSPNVVINTAAMTNVDLCDQNQQLCDDLNVNAVKYLADYCAKINCHLIHLSTDFIFDGKGSPYKEADSPNPLSYYGKSKLRSEQVLYDHSVKWTIIRTIVVFGVGENLTNRNIFLWAKNALENNKELNIVDDQFRAPTLAEDLAAACISAAKKQAYGIFHVSGKDIMSIYEIVVNIANHYSYDLSKINKIKTSDLNQRALRPTKTAFILEKSRKILLYNPHSFKQSLEIIDKQLFL